MAYDIEYASGIAWQQPLLRIPRSAAPRPGLVLLHGSEGAFAGWTDVIATELAYRGFVTYPHPYSQGGNIWQAGSLTDYALEETVKAMRWLRQHPAWRGSSEELKPTTPIEIERYAGPVILTTGAKDQMWSSRQTRRLAKRLKAAGRKPQVHIFKEDGHWYAPERLGRAYDLWTAFLERHLVQRDGVVAAGSAASTRPLPPGGRVGSAQGPSRRAAPPRPRRHRR